MTRSSTPSAQLTGIVRAGFLFALPMALLCVSTHLPCMLGKGYAARLYVDRQAPAQVSGLQAEALLLGRLALSDAPFGHVIDQTWSTSGGMSQVWGLGLPLLRTPFDLIARLFGSHAFPDYWLWGLALLGVQATLLVCIRRVRELLPEGVSPVEAAGVAGLIALCNPALAGLLQCKRLSVYEQAVFFGQLGATVLLAMGASLALKPSRSLFLWFSLLAGLGFSLRPTVVLYAFPLWVSVAVACRASLGIGILSQGAGIAAAGVAFVLATNQRRFGSALSFGYEIAMSGNVLVDYGIRFGTPHAEGGIGEQLRELSGALFFDDPGGHAWNEVAGQSRWLRFRDFSFRTTHWLHAIEWSAALVALYRVRRRAARGIRLVAVAGFVSLGFLLLFYLRSPIFADRYLSDFATALASAAGFLLVASPWRSLGCFLALILVCAGHPVLTVWNGMTTPFHAPSAMTAAEDRLTRDTLLRGWARRETILETYACAARRPEGLPWGFTYWNEAPDCRVHAMSSLVLPARGCLSVEVAGLPSTTLPRVLRERTALPIEGRVSVGAGERLTFCDDAAFPADALALYSIDWVGHPRDLFTGPSSVRMTAVSVSAR